MVYFSKKKTFSWKAFSLFHMKYTFPRNYKFGIYTALIHRCSKRFTLLIRGTLPDCLMQFTINMKCDTGAPETETKQTTSPDVHYNKADYVVYSFATSAMGSLTSPSRKTTDKCRRQGQRLNVTAQ